ncbi:MAG: 50S ribosomal protein L13 [Candidatus Kerfeldbacteria bacterium]|nr:50S ribosomal protein L13 [Candidatus Kerfeldbacteria bacterium]
MTTIEMNAAGQALGRLATAIAGALQGKRNPAYRPDRPGGVSVVVRNINQVRLTGRKRTQKMYRRFSGYPGGLKCQTAGQLLSHHPDQVLRLAVKRMLPNNRHREQLLQRLVIERRPT